MVEQSESPTISRPQAKNLGRNIRDRGYTARLTVDAATKREAYALRYRSYYSQGHTAYSETGLLMDEFDELATTRTVVVYDDGKAVGSIRTCLLRRGTETMSPCRRAYPREMDALLEAVGPERQGFDGVEVNRMVRAPEAADDQGLVFMLYRLAGYLALTCDFRVLVTCVRQHHVPFYKRLMFEQAGDAKVYPGLTCPMVLLKISRSRYDEMRQGFRLMDPDAGQAGILNGLANGDFVIPHIVRRV